MALFFGDRPPQAAPELGRGIIVTVQCPRAIWNLVNIHELPVAEIHLRDSKIISYGRTHIQAGVVVAVWPWAFAAEDILPMINLERSHIFPLSVTDALTMPDRHPVTLTDGLAVTDKRILEPRDHPNSLWLGVVIIDVIIWQSNIKRVLPGCKTVRDKISSFCRVILAPIVA